MSAAPELSRPLAFGRVPPGGRTVVVEATPAERAALARRFGLPAIGSLRAEVALMPEPGGAVRAAGRLRAAVVQACVVSLEPVEQVVDVALDLRFLPDPEGSWEPGEDPDGPDEIGCEDEVIELGEAVAEQLALALDPYPRHPDAVLPDAGEAVPDPGAPAGPAPFAALSGRIRPH